MEQFRIEIADGTPGQFFEITNLGNTRYQIFKEDSIRAAIQNYED